MANEMQVTTNRNGGTVKVVPVSDISVQQKQVDGANLRDLKRSEFTVSNSLLVGATNAGVRYLTLFGELGCGPFTENEPFSVPGYVGTGGEFNAANFAEIADELGPNIPKVQFLNRILKTGGATVEEIKVICANPSQLAKGFKVLTFDIESFSWSVKDLRASSGMGMQDTRENLAIFRLASVRTNEFVSLMYPLLPGGVGEPNQVSFEIGYSQTGSVKLTAGQ